MKIIFGASGYIGRNLADYFKKKNDFLAGTFYNSKRENLIHFDLVNPNLENLNIDLSLADYAIICSGIAKLADCQRNERDSYKINVEGTKKLINQCFEKNIIPIFISSERVFDGRKGNYTEEDLTNPLTVYGKQKKEVEDFLLSSNENYVIARVSKVFGIDYNDNTILTNWTKNLIQDQTIKCTTDQYFSLVNIRDLENCMDKICSMNLRGLYHISAPESFTRYNLAKLLKDELKISKGSIIPCSRKDFDFSDQESLDISVNSTKFRNVTNFEFRKMIDCIYEIKKNLNLYT